MKIIIFFLALFNGTAGFAQSPIAAPKQVKVIPAGTKNSALIPPIVKIVGPPKEINKKKRKLTPVTATGKRKLQSLSDSK